jgi:iron complex outermembrane receptor protein
MGSSSNWVRRGALMLTVSICAAMPASAHAQTPPDITEEIVVTGTRIPRADLTSASPIQSFGAEQITAHGVAQLEDFINTLPQASPDFSRTANNPGDGSARVNLRGLGADRTLTLLNGRRLAPAGVEGAADLNSLPTAVVERVDVVTGGASAVYGSDAIAGVVNFITRDNFEGVELSGQFDTYGAGDGDAYNASAVWGQFLQNRRAYVLLYADYLRREPVLQGARAFTRETIFDDPETGTLYPNGSPTGPNGLIAPQAVDGVFVPGSFFEAPGVIREVDFDTDFYNFAPINYLQIPLERWSAGAFGRFELTPHLEASLELMYSGPRSATQLASSPFTDFIDVTIADDFFAPATQDHLATNFDPDGDGVATFRFTRRLNDIGPRRSIYERDNYRLAAALEGDLGGWTWNGAYTFTRNDTHAEYENDASISRIRQGLLIGPLTGACVDASGGCVAVNLFGPNTLSPAAADFIRVAGVTEDTRVEQQDLTVFAGGDLFSLPAGPVKVSVGGEWLRVSTVYTPSPELATGDAAGFAQSPAVSGAFTVREAFGEILAPILADAPFARSLNFEAGARFTEHSTAGSYWTWKYGMQWRPVNALRIRGMVQRAVRTPNVRELYETPRQEQYFVPNGTDFCLAANDPVASGLADVCVAQGMDPDQIGTYDPPDGYIADLTASGNRDLEPEAGDTLTFGADWQFGAPWNVRLSADYFKVDLRDAILSADPLVACAAAGAPSDSTCALIHRDPSGFITNLENRPINYARAIVEGVDLGARADFAAPSWLAATPDAAFVVQVEATNYLRAASASSPNGQLFDCVGDFGCGSYDLLGAVTPEFVATSTLRYDAGPFSAMLRWRYIGPVDNSDAREAAAAGIGTPIMAIPHIGAINYIDLAVSYNLDDRARLSVGVDNVFEQDPPLLGTNQVQANTDPARYDVFGRRLFVRLSYRWN